MLEHFVSRAATDITYLKRSVSTKYSTAKRIRSFDLGLENGIEIPTHGFVGIMRRSRLDLQAQNKNKFNRPTVRTAQCV